MTREQSVPASVTVFKTPNAVVQFSPLTGSDDLFMRRLERSVHLCTRKFFFFLQLIHSALIVPRTSRYLTSCRCFRTFAAYQQPFFSVFTPLKCIFPPFLLLLPRGGKNFYSQPTLSLFHALPTSGVSGGGIKICIIPQRNGAATL